MFLIQVNFSSVLLAFAECVVIWEGKRHSNEWLWLVDIVFLESCC